MYSKEQLSSLIEDYIANLRFPSVPGSLYEPIRYSLERGGKRLRPLLALSACQIYSDEPSRALPAAAAVEVFHNFTLLHDDIMDNAAVRRGKPAVHRKWGVNSAILSGDAMMIYSYRLLEELDPVLLPKIMPLFSDTSMKVCEGQQYDMDFESLETVSMEEYIRMITLKTAVLLAGATVIGAVAGGALDEDCRHLDVFATKLGIAFQIQDDLLDSYGTEERLGKRIGGDILEGKKTFLTTAAMEAADDDTRIRLAGLMHNREMIGDEKIRRVLEIYDSLGVRRRAEETAERYTAEAIAALDALAAPAERVEPVRSLASELLGRCN